MVLRLYYIIYTNKIYTYLWWYFFDETTVDSVPPVIFPSCLNTSHYDYYYIYFISYDKSFHIGLYKRNMGFLKFYIIYYVMCCAYT